MKTILTSIFIFALAVFPLLAADEQPNSLQPRMRNRQQKKVKVRAKDHPLKPNFEKYLDLGTMYEKEHLDASFTLTNSSEETIHLKGIVATCTCTRMKTDGSDVQIPPGESYKVEFTMLGEYLPFTKKDTAFTRNILISCINAPQLKVVVAGRLLNAADVVPARKIDFGTLKTPVNLPTQTLTIKSSENLASPLVLGQPDENKYFDMSLAEKDSGEYDLTIIQKAPLPYKRDFHQILTIPILKPEKARQLILATVAEVAEVVAFAPEVWTISRPALKENGSFTGRFAYGEVPGLLEEEITDDNESKIYKASRLRQENSVPLKYVKAHHDWTDLQKNLQYEVPENVQLNVINHPQGIELQITVSEKSFANSKELKIYPHRQQEKCIPIIIRLVDEQ